VRGSVHDASWRRLADRPPVAGVWVPGRNLRAATGTTTATTTVTASRCAVTGTPRATMTAPMPAPATVPMLQPAWNLGKMAPPRPEGCPRHVHAHLPGPRAEPEDKQPGRYSGRAEQDADRGEGHPRGRGHGHHAHRPDLPEPADDQPRQRGADPGPHRQAQQ